jgi:hypothetical protein
MTQHCKEGTRTGDIDLRLPRIFAYPALANVQVQARSTYQRDETNTRRLTASPPLRSGNSSTDQESPARELFYLSTCASSLTLQLR